MNRTLHKIKKCENKGNYGIMRPYIRKDGEYIEPKNNMAEATTEKTKQLTGKKNEVTYKDNKDNKEKSTKEDYANNEEKEDNAENDDKME